VEQRQIGERTRVYSYNASILTFVHQGGKLLVHLELREGVLLIGGDGRRERVVLRVVLEVARVAWVRHARHDGCWRAAVLERVCVAKRSGESVVASYKRCERVANRNGRDFGWEMSSRGRFATPDDFPRHECSPFSHVHVRRERLVVNGPFFVAPEVRFAMFCIAGWL
jgi:hypothetical protein